MKQKCARSTRYFAPENQTRLQMNSQVKPGQFRLASYIIATLLRQNALAYVTV